MYTRLATLAFALASLVMINAQSLLPTLTYTLIASHVGYDFLGNFSWETEEDPTHGRVNYVDQATALKNNLTFVSDSKFVMRADDTKKVANTSRGRESVRIQSLEAYDDALFVLDIAHMPEGCSTWPAWWTLSQQGPWPHGGEIDIIEGVNLGQSNLASLHTTPNCTMPEVRSQRGNTTSTSCDTSVNSNQGCGVSFPEQNSYGEGFNDGGGGFYIMEKSSTKGVSVWFISRWDWLVLNDEPMLDLMLLSTPDAYFPMHDEASNCSYSDHFNAHSIVFDLTFCGDWAGSVWETTTCAKKASTCNSFVDNNPHEFTKAYWEINSLNIYTPTQDLLR
ncbi:glycoside hydrolase family 16 protein [Suillus paluster]|uniref:glycoside hydrolase family 16 protein n=1 Tax=Suillus paluster TaxID=48578 RepID=UPI001B87A6A3|nr:glycoside hydrolase family 16 protein [Suillus paluster]KAG1731523.1 glycoside hydrolase family 16 protein [Suillus paluster]